MKLLLDTHAFYWWCLDDPALSSTARNATADSRNEIYVSAISACEFVTKFRSGKEPAFAGIASDVAGAVAAQGFTELAISLRHAAVASNLPFHHKDPMDRFLIAQAIVEDMAIVTKDAIFAIYKARTLW